MIKYVNIQAILREKGRKYPELGIFYDTGNVIKVLCWQPKGEIVFSEEEGFRCNSNDHIEKATSFLLRGNETKADIILSPEYSVPWSILQRILEEQEPCPLNGKLWCLGLEGISCQELKKFLVANVEKNIICAIINIR